MKECVLKCQTNEKRREEFNKYYEKWREETLVSSVIDADNRWLKEIVNMGADAIMFIKEILDKEDNWIVLALNEIFFPSIKNAKTLHETCDIWRAALNQSEEK